MKPINNPIFLSTTFIQKKSSQWGYCRVDDPTRLALEKELAALEKAKHALAFSSGSSAIACIFALFKKGDHILCHREVYEGTHRQLDKIFNRFGIQFDLVDLNNLNEVIKNIKINTKLIFIESITNPNLEIIKINKLKKLTKNKILIAVDNTIATPVFKKPLLDGADLVVHSLTKFVGGHHDVLGGAIMLNNKTIFNKLKFIQQTIGFVLSPFDSFLVSKGIKTLEIRMIRHSENASRIFSLLKNHKKVERVIYPGFSGLISFTLKKDLNSEMFLKKLKFIKIAQSFGGTETTILHPNSMMDLFNFKNNNFFRLSVGIENVNEVICDLKIALK